MRADKPARWHADHLFARHPATRCWLIDTPLTECELVEVLCDSDGRGAGGGASRAAPGFGSSDCGCGGHLVRLPSDQMRDLARALAGVSSSSSRPRAGARGRVVGCG
jgi:Uri superfamily endonuclease